MSVTEQPRRGDPGTGRADDALLLSLSAFAVYHLALAGWMAISPHSFYTAIGPFSAYNSHYIRDTATFNAALGAGFVVAILRPSWRVPVLAITTLQFALHTINHLIDIEGAHPAGIGWFDFFALLLATVMLARLLSFSRHAERKVLGPPGGRRERTTSAAAPTSPVHERSTT